MTIDRGVEMPGGLPMRPARLIALLLFALSALVVSVPARALDVQGGGGTGGGTSIVGGTCGSQAMSGINTAGVPSCLPPMPFSLTNIIVNPLAPRTPDGSAAMGAKCDGSTDDTTAFSNALTYLNSNGGGTLVVPSTNHACVLSPDLVVPNSAATPTASQYPIRITGGGSDQRTQGGNYATAGATLSFGGSPTNGDIVTYGLGNLEIDHLSIVSSACSPIVYSTGTSLNVHDVDFTGKQGAGTACTDAIILGGTSTSAGNTTSAPMQGYGTTIVHNNFHQIRRAVLAQTYASSWWAAFNDYAQDSGNTSYCAFELNDPNTAGSLTGDISFNRIEMKYALCAFKSVNGVSPVFAFNELDDLTTSNNAEIVSLTNTYSAQIFAGAYGNPGAIPYVSADSGSSSYNYISNTQNDATNFFNLAAQSFSLNLAAGCGSPCNGIGMKDSAGDAWQQTLNPNTSTGFLWEYTPHGGSAYTLFSISDNSSTNLHFTLGGSSTSFIDSALNLRLEAHSGGYAYLGNDSNATALYISGADGSINLNAATKAAAGINITASTTGAIVPPKNAIGSLEACSSTIEGAIATATDCNAACSAGGTCTTGGSTHCQVRCNGTSYVETGL